MSVIAMNDATRSILIVDDNASIRSSLKLLLSTNGYTVFEVSNGADALDFIRKTPPVMVFLDIYMPDINGIDVLKQIVAEKLDTCVIMITGDSTMETAISSTPISE